MTKTEQKKQEAALKRILKNQTKGTAKINGALQDTTSQLITDTYRLIELNHPVSLPLDSVNRQSIDRVRTLFPADQPKECLFVSPKQIRGLIYTTKEQYKAGLLPAGWPEWMIELRPSMIDHSPDLQADRFRLNGRYLLDCMLALGCKESVQYAVYPIQQSLKAGSYYIYYMTTDQGRALLVGIR